MNKERKKRREGGVSKVSVSVVTPATVLTAVLVFDVQCLPAQLLRPLIHSLSKLAGSRSGCLCSCLSRSLLHSHLGLPFLPCCPWHLGTAAVLGRCFQQRQWKFGCCLQSEQGEAQLAASSGQTLRIWCDLFANRFILEVPGFFLSLIHHGTSTFGFVVVLLGVLLACFYGRGVVRVLEGTQCWSRPSAPSPALLKLMVLGGKKESRMQHHLCSSKQTHRCLCIKIQMKASCWQKR